MEDQTVTGKGLLDSFSNMLSGMLPFGLGTIFMTYLSKKTGQNANGSLFDFLPEGQFRDFLNGIADPIAQFINGIIRWIKQQIIGDEVAAQDTIDARIDQNKSLLASIDQEASTPGLSEKLSALMKTANANCFGIMGISTNPAEVISNARELFTDMKATIIAEVKKANPSFNDTQLEHYAAMRASQITGLPLAEDKLNLPAAIDPATITSGYAATMLKVQAGIAAEGDYDANTTPAITITLSTNQPAPGESVPPPPPTPAAPTQPTPQPTPGQ